MRPGGSAVGRAAALAALAVLLAAGPPWQDPAAAQAGVSVEDLEPEEGEQPPPAPDEPAGAPALEDEAEARYLEGDLFAAAAIYRRLAFEATGPDERMRLLVSAAWLEHQLGRYDEALELLSIGLAEAPDYPFQAQNYAQDFVDVYQRARRRALAERRTRAAQLVERSLAEIAAGDLERARATLRQALAQVPDDPFAQLNLALVDLRAGRSEEALAGFERLVAREAAQPESVPREVMAPALASLGLLYYEKDFFEDARRYLERATALDPEAPQAWNNLGLALRRLGDPAGAERAFRRALALSPGDPQVATNLSLMLLASNRHAEAVALLGDVTTRSPADAAAWLNLALAQRGIGDLAAAAESLGRILTLDAANAGGMAARAATYLAIVRYEQGDASATADAARRALDWNPADVEAWVYLGLARHQLGDAAGARDAFAEAARLDPARAEVHNNLGTALVALGDLAAAEEAFRQALAIRPDFAAARANLDQVVAQRARAAAAAGNPR